MSKWAFPFDSRGGAWADLELYPNFQFYLDQCPIQDVLKISPEMEVPRFNELITRQEGYHTPAFRLQQQLCVVRNELLYRTVWLYVPRCVVV